MDHKGKNRGRAQQLGRLPPACAGCPCQHHVCLLQPCPKLPFQCGLLVSWLTARLSSAGSVKKAGECWWGLEDHSCMHLPVPCSALFLTAKLLNWQSADQWLLEKCISGSQGMWHFRAFIQGTAGGHGTHCSPFSASLGQAGQWDNSTELGMRVSSRGTADTAVPARAVEDEPQKGHYPGSSLHCALTSSGQSSPLAAF